MKKEIMVLLIIALLGACSDLLAQGSSVLEQAKKRAAERANLTRAVDVTERAGSIRIAVLPFKTSSGLPCWWEGTFDPGRAISDMVTSCLMKSSRFIVFDRNNLQTILTEQNLSTTGMITAETAVQIGRLAGVQFLVTGSLVEFTRASSGGGGVKIPTSFGDIGGGGSKTKVRTTVEVQMIDVTTGLVAASVSARDQTSVGGSEISVSIKGYSATTGREEFASSGLGKSMSRVAQKLAQGLETAEIKMIEPPPPIEGYVMGVEGDQVILNIGSRDGVLQGMVFGIARVKEMVDPVSGQMKNVNMPLCEVKIISVQADACIGTAPGAGSKGIQPRDSAVRK